MEHFDKVDAWVRSETTAGRYITVEPLLARGTVALGVVEENHSNFAKVRVVHAMSRPEGSSTNGDIDIPGYSGHSFRRGGATFAFRLEMDPFLVKRMGDWVSDAYMGYIEHHTPQGLVRLPRSLAAACAVYE
jgi:hypothetical protein